MNEELRELLSKFKIFSEQRWGGWTVTLVPISSEKVVQNEISKPECEEMAAKLNKLKGK